MLVCAPSRATAEEPDGALAVLVGGATNLVGIVVGAALTANQVNNEGLSNAGWLTIETGFALAPLTAHAVVGEWGRGALFAAAPAATLGGTVALFAAVPDAVDSGSLDQQRLMWGLLVAGQLASVAGIIDAALAPGQSKTLLVAPVIGLGKAGAQIGGVF